MNLSEAYNELITEDCNPYTNLGKEIVNNITSYGLGVLPKSDLEGLIFHCICNALENQYYDDIQNLDYILMEMLRISPSKLRSLRITRSAKFLNNLDYNNPSNLLRIIAALKNAPIGNEDIFEGKIKISISDPHTQNLIERLVEYNKGVMDRSLNSKILSLDAKQFLHIISIVFGEGGEDGYEQTIKAIKAEIRELHDDITKDNILDKLHEAFQEKAFGKMVEIGIRIARNAISKKLGLE